MQASAAAAVTAFLAAAMILSSHELAYELQKALERWFASS